MQPVNSSYPATLEFDAPEKVANRRAAANWCLALTP